MQKFKKPVSIILSILMVVSMFVVVPFTASAAEETSTVTWNSFTTSGGMSSGGVTLTTEQGNTRVGRNFYAGRGSATFTAPEGSAFTKIELKDCSYVDSLNFPGATVAQTGSYYDEWDEEWYNTYTVTWTGESSEVTFSGAIYGIQSIVFTLKSTAPDYVATVNGTGYDTLEAAIEAAQTGDTVLVVNEITDLSQITIPAGKKITLDLGNQKVSGEAGLFKVPYGTSLTVKNGTLESVAENGYAIYVASNDEKGGTFVLNDDATIKTTGTGSGAVRGYANASITINGTIDAATYGVVVTKSAKLTVNSPAVIKGSENAIASNGNSGNGGYSITIKGGTIGTEDTNTAIYHQNKGTLTINGGTVQGKTAVYVKSGTTTINGGTFTSTKDPGENYSYNGNGTNSTGDTIVVDNCGYPGGAPTIAIKGGTFNVTDTENANPVASYSYGDGNDEVEEFVSGGTFNRPVPADYCAPAYTPADNGDGTYGVTLTYVAQVGDDKYETFAEAVDAANGSLIKILSKDATPYVMSVDQTIVTDNYTNITIVAPEGAYVINRAYDSTAKTYTFTVIDAAIEYTATNGTVSYKSNIDYTNMGGSGTYKLLKDITCNSRIVPSTLASNVTVDLNGHTLTSTATDEAFLFSRAGSAASHNSYTITNGTIIAPGDGIQLLANYADLTLDKVTINASGDYGIVTNGTKTGNNITVTDSAITADDAGIYKPSNGALTLTDTSVEGKVAVYVKSGTVVINGGTFTGTGAKADYTYNGSGINPTGDAIVVDNCGYPGGAPSVSIGGNLTINSTNGVEIGDYAGNGVTELAPVTATDNTLSLPEGLKWVETATEGVYEVAPDYVAEVNGDGYMTFAEAVAARTSNNDVISLLKKAGTYTSDDHTEFPIKVQKNGKSLTVNIDDAPYYTTNSASDGVTTYVAVEGKVKYTSTNGTVTYKGNIDYSNIGGSGTYQLLDNITANSRIVPGIMASNVTIDLNGHTLTSNATDEAFLFSRAGSAASHNSYTITNGTIIAAGDGIQLLANYADLTLDGVTVNAAGDYGIVTNGTKKGNNITVTDSVITADDAGIYKPSNGALTLTDTTVEGKVAVYVKSGTVAINGGTFTGTGAKADYTYNGNGINPTGDAIVVDSCGYPGGAPSVSIGGNPTIASTNGKQIGDYAYGNNDLGDVTATSNTMTLPAGLKWVETDTPGVYEVGQKLFVGHNLLLGGDIGVNFYLNPAVLDAYTGTKTVKFTVDGEEATVAVPSTKTDYGYKVTLNVVAARMAHKINAVVYVGGTALAETDSYSVQDYAETVYKDPEAYDTKGKPEQLKALAEAMLHYGGEAQTVFADDLNEKPDHRADKNVGTADYSGVDADAVTAKINGTASNLAEAAAGFNADYYTSSLIYLKNNTLRIYFTPKSKKVNGLDGVSGFNGNLSYYYYYTEKTGIAAAELDNQQSFTVGNVTFNYSALDYVVAVLNSGMSETQKNLAKSLFLYNQKANAYF